MRRFFVIFFLIFINQLLKKSFPKNSTVTVRTKYGQVQGFVALNNTVNVFFGVPFAAPPVGNLRFEKPVEPSPWEEPLIANVPPSPCIQHTKLNCWTQNCKEDCLYLNIYAPHQQSTATLFPVLVLIHGGAFEVGSAAGNNNYTEIGRRYVSKGLVIVSIQYRLSVLGFASVGDDMPGNYGLWDQRAALQFVVVNIERFGGDPNRVTLWGISAGSASVSLLSISPHSRDLFQQSMQMSGTPLAAWACNNGQVKNASLALARALNCIGGVKECLKNKTVGEIQDAQLRVGTTDSDKDVNFVNWGPLVDGEFLPRDIPVLMEEASAKPTVLGFADLESMIWTLRDPGNNSITHYVVPISERARYDQSRFEAFVRDVVARTDRLSDEVAEAVQLNIIDFYLKETESGPLKKNTSDFYLQKMSMVLSDMQFIVPIIWETQLKAGAGWPIYLYISTYFNEAVIASDIHVRQNFHGNDMNYLFYQNSFEFNDNDTMMNDFFTNGLINFIKTGNPSNNIATWSPYCVERKGPACEGKIMHIGLPRPQMQPMTSVDAWHRMQFWTRMVQKYPNFNLIQGIYS